MVFVFEDGTGMALANSLVGVIFADTYFAEIGSDAWVALTVTEKEQSLVKATRFFEKRYVLYGKRQFEAQGTPYPRTGLVNSFGSSMDGTVPGRIKNGICELALVASTEALFFTPALPSGTGGQITRKKEKVGPLEEETVYAAPSQGSSGGDVDVTRRLPNAEYWFKGFIKDIDESLNSAGVYR